MISDCLQSTQKDNVTRTALRHIRSIEAVTASLDVSVGREHILYGSDVPVENLDYMVSILSHIIHPRLPEWEVRDEREVVSELAKHDMSGMRSSFFTKTKYTY